uniref:Uncharacterized protein n=1 Tax=Steinernema glaseri TaxID=37863 RepID=A0A1I7ZGE7_9BILA
MPLDPNEMRTAFRFKLRMPSSSSKSKVPPNLPPFECCACAKNDQIQLMCFSTVIAAHSQPSSDIFAQERDSLADNYLEKRCSTDDQNIN